MSQHVDGLGHEDAAVAAGALLICVFVSHYVSKQWTSVEKSSRTRLKCLMRTDIQTVNWTVSNVLQQDVEDAAASSGS